MIRHYSVNVVLLDVLDPRFYRFKLFRFSIQKVVLLDYYACFKPFNFQCSFTLQLFTFSSLYQTFVFPFSQLSQASHLQALFLIGSKIIRTMRKKDKLWEYVEKLDGSHETHFKCKFCDRNFPGGITIVKSHAR